MCERPVCETCLAPDTCPDPSERELRLGFGARLRDVDDQGRYGLVSTWTGRGKLVDLATGDTLIRKLPMASPTPMLMADSTLVSLQLTPQECIQGGLQVTRLDDLIHKRVRVDRSWSDMEFIFKTLTKSGDGRLALMIRGNETVSVTDVARQCLVGSFSVRGQVVHSVAANGETDMLALGTYGRVSLFRVSDQQSLGSCRLKGDGNVIWIGLGRRRVVAITEHGRCNVIDIDLSLQASRWKHARELKLEHTSLPTSFAPQTNVLPLTRASLDPDGELLAVPRNRRVLVYRLRTGAYQTLRGHTDEVGLLRFVCGGQLLVTADDDARVRIWPRQGDEIVEARR